MTASLSFTVDRSSLNIDPQLLHQDAFTVHSALHPYRVRLSQKTPQEEMLKLLEEHPQAAWMVDENLKSYLPQTLLKQDRIHFFQARETHKDLEHGVLPLLDRCVEWNLTKTDPLVVVGGGVTQEVGALTAALYKRGLPWILFPTTVLAMCDSCLGGKSSLNFRGAKNQLGLYYPPQDIILCPAFLNTLSDLEIRSGMGEILKLHALGGSFFWDRYLHLRQSTLQRKETEALATLVWEALLIKKSIVESDEFEKNERKSMNYGHTLGHAFEALSEHRIPHGLAVVLGALAVNTWASRQGLTQKDFHKAFFTLGNELLTDTIREEFQKLSFKELPSLLSKDKKNSGDSLLFVYLERAGVTRYQKTKNSSELFSDLEPILKSLLTRQDFS